MKKLQSISIVFPCYNDAKSIGVLINAALNTVQNITNDYEIIVVDDGSTDSSRKVLKKLQKTYRHLLLIFHSQNRGYGSALRSGFQKASKQYVFYTDGDGQYDVNELSLLINAVGPKVNFVNGIKIIRHDPSYRIVMGNIYNFITRCLFWLPVKDPSCDFRLIKRSLLKQLSLQGNSGSFCIELVKKAQLHGAIFAQIPVHHFKRKHGMSQFFRIERLFSTILELIKLWVSLMLSKRY